MSNPAEILRVTRPDGTTWLYANGEDDTCLLNHLDLYEEVERGEPSEEPLVRDTLVSTDADDWWVVPVYWIDAFDFDLNQRLSDIRRRPSRRRDRTDLRDLELELLAVAGRLSLES